MKTLIITLLIIHVATGTIALLTGLVPMFSKKGSKLHNRTGLIYVYCMIIVAVTALLLCGLQPFKMMRLFLTGIAVFSFYLCFTGWRATRQKSGQATTFDRGLTYVTLAVSASMIGFGLYLISQPINPFFPILFTFFGILTGVFASKDTRQFGKPAEKMHWFFQHFTRMGGSYIATFTASLVTNIARVLPANAPDWSATAAWILPSLIGGMLIGRTVAYYRRKFSTSKPAALAVCGLLLCVSLATSAQSTVSQVAGTVVDQAGRPLAYASVGVIDKPIGTVADEGGKFQVFLTDAVQPTDSIRVSLLGHASKTMLVAAVLQQPDRLTIILTDLPATLSEVFVKTTKLITKTIGNKNTDASMRTNFAISGKPRQNLGAEIGRVFALPKKGAFLDEFAFYVSANNFDSTRVRVNVYKLKGNYPTDNLLQQPIYVDIKPQQTGWITVDLRPYNLYATNDVAVAVEWVSYGQKGSFLGIPITMPSIGATHLYKYGSQNRWKKYGQMSACMNLTLACN
jgi:uncharacterized membrane protein